MKILGHQRKNGSLQRKYRGLQWKFEALLWNMGISNENMGFQMKIWGSSLKSGGLHQDVHGGLQWEGVSNSTPILKIFSRTRILKFFFLGDLKKISPQDLKLLWDIEIFSIWWWVLFERLELMFWWRIQLIIFSIREMD